MQPSPNIVYKIDNDFFQNLQCKKPDHKGKILEFVCSTADCPNRLLCSYCILNKDHAEHLDTIQHINDLLRSGENEEMLDKIKKRIPNIEEIEALCDNRDNEEKAIRAKIEENTGTALSTLRQFRSEMQDHVQELILQSIPNEADGYLADFTEKINRLATLVKGQPDVAETVTINSLEVMQIFVEETIKSRKPVDDIGKEIPRLYAELKGKVKIEKPILVDHEKLKNIKDLMGALLKVERMDALLKFDFHRRRIAIPTSKSDYKTLKNTKTIKTEHTKSIYRVIFLEDLGYLVTASDDSTVRVWDMNTNKEVKSLQGHTDRIWNMIQLSNGLFVTSSSDQTIRVWDLKAFKCEAVLTGHTGYVCALMEMPDLTLMSGSHDQSIKTWDLKVKVGEKCVKTFKNAEQGRLMTMILVNEKEMAVGSDNNIHIYDQNEGKVLRTLQGHSGLLRDLLLLDDRNTLLSGSDDRSMKLWNLSLGTCIRTFTGHQHSVNRIIHFQEGILATCSDDATIKFWSKDKSEPIHSLVGHESWTIYMTIRGDGALVSCGFDKTVRFWS